MAESASADDTAELEYLRSPRAIRERAEKLYGLAARGALAHFALDEGRLPAVVERVLEVTRESYPDFRSIPYHGRFRHFGAARLASLERALEPLSREERLEACAELVITSVLLDAGAGASWSYRDASGARFTRSEGLAVASFDWFAAGGFSLDSRTPLRADAEKLATITASELGAAFQVTAANPLTGLEGRAALLRELGRVSARNDARTGSPARGGGLARRLLASATGGELPATRILAAVLSELGEIWPGREELAGQNLGDVWRHPAVGRVPFHKLSQWLAYSLCEPLEAAGSTIRGLDELTGLAEYRNGGLFLDGGVLVPKHDAVLGAVHAVGSEVVVEWRALTIALLDRTAARLCERVGMSAEELPLARVLEGGTWRAGRVLASERRADGGPPLRVASDGTVF
jgi:hypothetical protein